MSREYTWKANYNDNTSLRQIDSDGTKHSYADIQRDKLVSFEILHGEEVVLSIPFESGQKLIWRRRTAMNPGGSVAEIVHLVGKQEIVNGENRQAIVALFESDGHTEISDRWDDTHPWFFRVRIHPHEGEENING